MTTDTPCPPVTVSRTIQAPADRIFAILADPVRHCDLDGSDMLRGLESPTGLTGIDDVFAMKMHFEPLGDYVMRNRVVEWEPGRRIGWAPSPGDQAATGNGPFAVGQEPGHRWGFELTPDGADRTVVTETYDCSAAPTELRQAVGNGDNWIPAMTETLVRLDALATRPT